nr:class II glutamine amidotransferase [Amycolatopsis sp. CA-128772]
MVSLPHRPRHRQPLVVADTVAREVAPAVAAERHERTRRAGDRERQASTGGLEPANTHPFVQHDRLFAHNGVIGDLPALEDLLGDYRDLVEGDTDSERFFALVTREIDAHGGDVGAGIGAAARWAAALLPVYALDLVLTTPTELWALRYPEIHDLYVLHRAPGGPHGDRHLEHASAAGRIRAASPPPGRRRRQ